MERDVLSEAPILPMKEALLRFERWYLSELLLQTRSMRKAARVAQVDRAWLYKLVKRCGLVNGGSLA